MINQHALRKASQAKANFLRFLAKNNHRKTFRVAMKWAHEMNKWSRKALQ